MMLNKYLIKLDESDVRMISHNIKIKGLKETIESYLHDMDCTRVYSDGSRPNQTINYQYRYAVSAIYFVLDSALNRKEPLIDKLYFDDICDRMENIHINNINYEKINPPIVYRKKKSKTIKTTKIKTEKIDNDKPKEKKVTVAERKLADKVAKLNKLTFNFKIKEA